MLRMVCRAFIIYPNIVSGLIRFTITLHVKAWQVAFVLRTQATCQAFTFSVIVNQITPLTIFGYNILHLLKNRTLWRHPKSPHPPAYVLYAHVYCRKFWTAPGRPLNQLDDCKNINVLHTKVVQFGESCQSNYSGTSYTTGKNRIYLSIFGT